MKIFKYIVGLVFLLFGTFGVQSVSTSFEAKAEAAEVHRCEYVLIPGVTILRQVVQTTIADVNLEIIVRHRHSATWCSVGRAKQ